MGYFGQTLWDILWDILVKNCWIYLAKIILKNNGICSEKTMGCFGQKLWDILG